MKSFDEYRNFYETLPAGGEGGEGGLTPTVPVDMPEPKTYKEFVIAALCGLEFGPPPEGLEPKTPIEKYLTYMLSSNSTPPGQEDPIHNS